MALYQGTTGHDSLTGTSGNDTITGGAGNDTLSGMEGSDLLDGGAGNDVIDGGAGTDAVSFRGNYRDYDISWNSATQQFRIVDRLGRDGMDLVTGVETFRFADGARSLNPQAWGGRTVTGTNVNEALSGSSGNDTLLGLGGDDTLAGGPGQDSIDGGAGTDRVRFSSPFSDYRVSWDSANFQYVVTDLRSGRDGTDVVTRVESFQFADGVRSLANLVPGTVGGERQLGTAGSDTLVGNIGNDSLDGQAGNDTVAGGAGNDTLLGGEGDDEMGGGAGDDRIDGGGGPRDTAFFMGNFSDYAISWDAAAQRYVVRDGVAGRDGTDTVGGVTAFGFADGVRSLAELGIDGGEAMVLAGTEGADVLRGAGGDDLLAGGDGNDTLLGEAGSDSLEGGGGDDVLEGGRGSDRIAGGGGGDVARFSGARADYDIRWDAATREYKVTELASGSVDTVRDVEFFQFADGTFDWATLVDGAGDGVVLAGTAADEYLLGSNGYDQIDGGDGRDIIDARAADDAIDGGAGDDEIRAGEGNDVIEGGSGFDTVLFDGATWEYQFDWNAATRQYTISHQAVGYPGINDGVDVVSGVENFVFRDGVRDWSNLVPGTGDGVVLTGTEANEFLFGSDGYDSIAGGEGRDTIHALAANDSIDGGAGDDEIEGGAGGDVIAGGSGWDKVFFTGYAWEYQVSWDAATRQYVIVHQDTGYWAINDGADSISGVENFVFRDGSRDWSTLVPGTGDGVVLAGTEANEFLFGSDGYDSIAGGDGRDTIHALAANDSIDGGAGDDEIEGGAGNDVIAGGSGWDKVFFTGYAWEYQVSWDAATRQYVIVHQDTGYWAINDGADSISGVENFVFRDGSRDWSNLVPGMGDGVVVVGTEANAFLYGSDGYDVLRGGSGHETLNGMGGNDSIDGGIGDDELQGGTGNDLIEGGIGWDRALFSGDASEYQVSWDAATRQYTIAHVASAPWGINDGVDTVSGVETFVFRDGVRDWSNLVPGTGDGFFLAGTALDDVLVGSHGYDTLLGGDGNDMVYAMDADDIIEGGAGDDSFQGSAGNDRIDGGSGWDRAGYSGAFSEYQVTWNGATREYTIAHVARAPWNVDDGVDTVSGVESFVFSDGWRSWGDLVPGEGDGELVTGTPDPDWLYGTDGYDTVVGGDGNDRLVGNAGGDLLAGEAGDDSLEGGWGNDTLDGGEGTDTAYFHSYFSQFNTTWNATTGEFTVVDPNVGEGTDVVRNVEYFSFRDGALVSAAELRGEPAGLVLNGTSAFDYLWGTARADTILGFEGDDMLRGVDGNDVIAGGDGDDAIWGDGGDDRLEGGSGIDTVTLHGEAGEYLYSFDSGTQEVTVTDLIAGRDGTDVLRDVEYIQFASGTLAVADLLPPKGVTLPGTPWADFLTGTAGADILLGFEADDVLDGAAGDDLVDGGDGQDVLVGGSGQDQLWGGAGFDTATFQGSYWEYAVAWDGAAGTFTVTDWHASRDGVDQVRDVEIFNFGGSYFDASYFAQPVGTQPLAAPPVL